MRDNGSVSNSTDFLGNHRIIFIMMFLADNLIQTDFMHCLGKAWVVKIFLNVIKKSIFLTKSAFI